MKGTFSLSLRLIAYLLAAQVIGVMVAVIVVDLLAASNTLHHKENEWDDLAELRTAELVIESLQFVDGKLSIAPTPALQGEMQRAPALRFAVFAVRSNTPIAGSSPDLVAEFSRFENVRMVHTSFTLADEKNPRLRGHIMETRTPFGLLRVASYGHLFHWLDVLYLARRIWIETAGYLVLITALVCAIGWLALKGGLAPLNKLAREAEGINLETLDQRLSVAGVPSEFSTLVAAMNRALERLDEGVNHQRRFLANAAHELRTPIAILKERIDCPEKDGSKVGLQRDVDRLHAIVEQLLATARLYGAGDASEEKLDLAEILRACVDDHALLAVKTRRQVALEEAGRSVPVRGERRAIESVLDNLLSNALNSEPVGGTIIVRLGDDAIVEVIDHGEGVASADREAVFEPFWRKNSSTPGTGLGLAITKELIGKLGGRIWVEDTPGGGATFKLWFPAVTSETHANLNNAHSASRTNAPS